MSDRGRLFLVVGLVAGLVQVAVPPHAVRASDILGETSVVITRWYPVGGEPKDLIYLRESETADPDDRIVFLRSHEINLKVLAIQLLATAIATGLLVVLFGASTPGRPTRGSPP